MTRIGPIALLLTVLLLGSGWSLSGPVADFRSETSAAPSLPLRTRSAAPRPAAAFVSELGPAAMLSPQEPAELPASGSGTAAAAPWPKAAGVGLALLGALLIHGALTLRPKGAG